MIHLLPTFRLPRLRRRPVSAPQPAAEPPTEAWWALVQPDLRQRVIASRTPHCWGCGRPGASFCGPDPCLPPGCRNAIPTWVPCRPDPVDAAEIAEDARLAAALDRESAA